ncbi:MULTISPECIES: hypothetical protein [Oxalobacteraceae]|jgi:hypothetical protein|uniref:hypothetical protein n=1 Tax=Oxalobacteraceae TaxID=75682 RepID=UPI0010A4511E|nr:MULTISPECIES: hypothetical protein [Oxalobacteraceae]
MKKRFGLAVIILTNLVINSVALAGDSFTGTWYVHVEEASEQPDFWEELNLIQIGTHICGEWSAGAKLKQRIDEGYIVGKVNGKRATINRCVHSDKDPSPGNCPDFSKKWRDVFVRHGEKIVVWGIGRDGHLHTDGIPLSRTSKVDQVSEEALHACRRWSRFGFQRTREKDSVK